MDKLKAFQIILTGKVQGVGFRHFAQRKALELGLDGWVRNKEDGSVEIEIEGDLFLIRIFTDRLKSGNAFSRVDRIFTKELPEIHGYNSFYIKNRTG